jgi:hypothetical protein
VMHIIISASLLCLIVIVLNLFIILVQLLEPSCVQMLCRTTKLRLLLHVQRRLIRREAISILYNLYVIILAIYSLDILPYLSIYLSIYISIYLSMILYSILFYHVCIARAFPLV